MNKSTAILRLGTLSLLVLTLTTISTLSIGCRSVRVISADRTETKLKAGEPFTPSVDGMFLPSAQYQKYRRYIADKITEEQLKESKVKP